ncbi:outer membrane protein OmpK [Vibrio sp. HN007]|uniref:nucleoside-specific channel-forming Tsx family protein n=1 Tax=Vibrio iocasae TaxID=3098914 RepID=UPI0035D42BED
MKKTLLSTLLLSLIYPSYSFSAEYNDIHENDYKWMQFNLMHAFNEKPGNSDHDYLEMEFGGRSGIFDLYGYVDVFNLTSDPDSDKAKKDAKIFMKFAPRMSIDAVTGKDLSFGPINELYVSSEMNWDGNTTNTAGYAVNQQKIGLGADVTVPWLGKVGMNLLGVYDSHHKDWNGYQIGVNWFKPFYFFEGGAFLSYQGYAEYQFNMKESYSKESGGGATYQGLHWHSERFAVGYGLKAYKTIYGLEDGGFAGDTTGIGHFISVTYKI